MTSNSGETFVFTSLVLSLPSIGILEQMLAIKMAVTKFLLGVLRSSQESFCRNLIMKAINLGKTFLAQAFG